MKAIRPLVIFVIAVSLFSSGVCTAQDIVEPVFDQAHVGPREQAFTPWMSPQQSGETWRSLSPTHIPILNEQKSAPGHVFRAIYIPNPGTGYWTLSGLTKEELLKTEKDHLKINDKLVSLFAYPIENGQVTYWALWVPASKAYLIQDKLQEYGITPGCIKY